MPKSSERAERDRLTAEIIHAVANGATEAGHIIVGYPLSFEIVRKARLIDPAWKRETP